jgi:hypothetical protein
MKLKNLLQLKKKLQKESDLGKIYHYYMDEFGDKAEFADVGEPIENSILEAVVPQICYQIFRKKVLVHNLLIIHLPEYDFFHGPFFTNNHIGGVIYFEDIQKGLVALSSTDNMAKYSRFTAAASGKEFDRN